MPMNCEFRARYSLICPLQRPEYERKTFAYVGANLVNALPCNAQICTSLYKFKKLCEAFDLELMDL